MGARRSLHLKSASQGQLAEKGRGQQGRGSCRTPSAGTVSLAWYWHPVPWGRCYQLPGERVSGCMLECGVPGSRAQLTDGAWGGWGDGRKGMAAKSGAGGARGAGPPTGPILAPGTLYPQTLREQMPSSLFPEGVGWGEAGDSVLMGTGCGVGCLCCSRSESWGVGVGCSGSLWALGSR